MRLANSLVVGAWALAMVASDAAPAAAPAAAVPVCAAAGNQVSPAVVGDGKGGAIVAWCDFRHGQYDVYAHHLLASGRADPSWPKDGRAVCEAPGDQANLAIIPDGQGGAIVAWQDVRSVAGADVRAQHLLGTGRVDPKWPRGGQVVCDAPNHQLRPMLAPDGEGGALVTWYDYRGGDHSDVYAHHLMPSGRMDPRWPANGLALSTAPDHQTFPAIAADGTGGAFVTWYDHRGGRDYDIYVQRVSGAGEVPSGWPAGGLAVCDTTGDQRNPQIVADGSAGAWVAWEDARAGKVASVYVQHLSGAGGDPSWPARGLRVAAAQGPQRHPALAEDGEGGAIVAWDDSRGEAMDIYAQHVRPSGALDPAWPAAGLPLTAAAADQWSPVIVADGAGGAFVAWFDLRGGNDADVYAQHALASGTIDPAWPTDGLEVATGPGNQAKPALAATGRGTAIVVWEGVAGPESNIDAAPLGTSASSRSK